jgi:hypothetical protein
VWCGGGALLLGGQNIRRIKSEQDLRYALQSRSFARGQHFHVENPPDLLKLSKTSRLINRRGGYSTRHFVEFQCKQRVGCRHTSGTWPHANILEPFGYVLSNAFAVGSAMLLIEVRIGTSKEPDPRENKCT